MDILFLLLGLFIGGGLVFAVTRHSFGGQINFLDRQLKQTSSEYEKLQQVYEQEKNAKITYQTKLEETKNNIEEQKKLLDEANKKLSDNFEALSKNALHSNNQMFMNLAKQTLEKMIIDFKGDSSKSKQALDSMIKPLQESLKRYDEQIQRIEVSRQKEFGSFQSQLKGMMDAHITLSKETRNLSDALKKPQVRGRWGEITLKRVVELSGMSQHCDFTEQVSQDSLQGRVRPDLIVNLPNERVIIVDAKTPLQAYLDALSASTDEERTEHLKRHANHVAEHMKSLGKKAYWDQFDKTPEIVVMFIPGESFFSAAVDVNKSLIEDGIQNKVIIATPTTLIALLRAVAYGWRQETITKNALEIRDLGSALFERISVFLTNFVKVGKSLESTIDSYNKSVGSLETRVLVTARKFKDLGVGPKDTPLEAEQIEKIPRQIQFELTEKTIEEPIFN